jgi:hypothetical protein
MFRHQSAYLDRNLYRPGNAGQMPQEYIIEQTQEMDVKTHIRAAN